MLDGVRESFAFADDVCMAVLLAKLSTEPGDRKDLRDWLGERASVHGGDEDPGAVIVQAFAEQQARADEFKIISEDVRRLVEVDNRR